jgi:ABC-type antimicrobial peptide transport system permease subunit
MASMTTGAAVGAAVGSVVPIAGTAVGTVIGVLAGTAGGIFTSGMVDHIYESGTSSALGTVMAGVNELGGAADATADLLDATVGGVTRLGRGVLDAVF